MTTRVHVRRGAIVTAAVVAFCCAVALGAQAGPPLARAPGDSAPPLKKLVPPSAPPSSVAPRGNLNALRRLATADSGPQPMRRVSAPVDSVRPKPAVVNAPDPRRAPPTHAPPPAPGTSTAGVQQVALRAALVSDIPPAGATARCKDGSFVSSAVDATTCSASGGLAVRIPVPPPAPKRPTP